MDKKKIDKMLSVLHIELDPEEKELDSKKLMKAIMRKWINAADAILEMMIMHLPSPKEAQKYRYSYLY